MKFWGMLRSRWLAGDRLTWSLGDRLRIANSNLGFTQTVLYTKLASKLTIELKKPAKGLTPSSTLQLYASNYVQYKNMSKNQLPHNLTAPQKIQNFRIEIYASQTLFLELKSILRKPQKSSFLRICISFRKMIIDFCQKKKLYWNERKFRIIWLIVFGVLKSYLDIKKCVVTKKVNLTVQKIRFFAEKFV